MGKSSHILTHLLQMTVKLLHWSGVIGKELFIRFTASAFRKLPSVCVFGSFPFGFEGRMWDMIVSVPDHCLSFYFAYQSSCDCAVWWP